MYIIYTCLEKNQNYVYINILSGILKRSNIFKLCDLLSPPAENTKGSSGFDARHNKPPRLVFFSQITLGFVSSIISHTLIIPSFAEVTRSPGHDELSDKPIQ